MYYIKNKLYLLKITNMKKILLALLVAVALAPAAQAQNNETTTTPKTTATKPAMIQELGLGTTLSDGYTRVKYGANNVYKKFGAYALYEFKGATSTQEKYSTVVLGANYFYNAHWGAFAGIGLSNGRKEMGISYRTAKYGGLDLGYSSTVGATVTILYPIYKKK